MSQTERRRSMREVGGDEDIRPGEMLEVYSLRARAKLLEAAALFIKAMHSPTGNANNASNVLYHINGAIEAVTQVYNDEIERRREAAGDA